MNSYLFSWAIYIDSFFFQVFFFQCMFTWNTHTHTHTQKAQNLSTKVNLASHMEPNRKTLMLYMII